MNEERKEELKNELMPVLMGLNYCEWVQVSHVINRVFESKVKRETNKIELGEDDKRSIKSFFEHEIL